MYWDVIGALGSHAKHPAIDDAADLYSRLAETHAMGIDEVMLLTTHLIHRRPSRNCSGWREVASHPHRSRHGRLER